MSSTEQVIVLKKHSGMVKGVTWDPVGKYLASQVSFQGSGIVYLALKVCCFGGLKQYALFKDMSM